MLRERIRAKYSEEEKGEMKRKSNQQTDKNQRNPSGSMSISRKVSSGAMLVALAMIFSYVEA